MKKQNIIIVLLFILIIFILPCVVFAAEGSGSTQPAPPQPLPNPLGSAGANSDPRVIIGQIISALLGIVGSIALVVFVAGGFLWMTSAGNKSKVDTGKNMIVWAVLGLGIIFLSYAIVKFVLSAFKVS